MFNEVPVCDTYNRKNDAEVISILNASSFEYYRYIYIDLRSIRDNNLKLTTTSK